MELFDSGSLDSQTPQGPPYSEGRTARDERQVHVGLQETAGRPVHSVLRLLKFEWAVGRASALWRKAAASHCRRGVRRQSMSSNGATRIFRLSVGFWAILLCGMIAPSRGVLAQTAVTFESNIPFATHGGVRLKLDIAVPRNPTGSYPALVYISGSGWGHWWGPSFDRHQYDGAIRRAAARGYVAATVGYRPTSVKVDGRSKYRYPDQLLDVRSAVRWLRAHAANYHIDVNRFGAIGWSSGGHLSLLLGLLDPNTTFPGEHDNLSYSSGVQAVVSITGTTDMARMYREATYPGMQGVISDLMGGTPDQFPNAYREASPLYHVTKNAPPILMIQGDSDIEVPPDQATMLQRRLQAVDAHPRLIMLEYTGHYNDVSDPAIFPFFDSVLKRK